MPVDIEALRAAAEKATPGKRIPCRDGIATINEDGGRVVLYASATAQCPRAYDNFYGCATPPRAEAFVRMSDADRTFTIACDPTTILALLAERDRLLRVVKAARLAGNAWSSITEGELLSGVADTTALTNAMHRLRQAVEALAAAASDAEPPA